MYDWSHFGLCDAESSDLMFSIVSSGMGATVCTAGRFLLVAPLTNDEEEEEDEEAESVAPAWEARGARVMKKSNVSQRRESAATEVGTQGNNGGRERINVRSDAAKLNLDRISPDMLLLLLVFW